MAQLGKLLIGFGLLLVLLGGLLVAGDALGGKLRFLGRLPGDIAVQRGNWSLYVPLTTSLLLSIVLTLILAFLGRR